LPWGENHRLQFRWEMYNVLNHPNFAFCAANTACSSLDINSGNFGLITTTIDTALGVPARTMQFALRYDF